MFELFHQILRQIFNALVHDWDTLVKKVGKQTANVLLAYIALGVLFEAFWLTLLVSILALIYVLK